MDIVVDKKNVSLGAYRKNFEKKRIHFQSHSDSLTLSIEASQKYQTDGTPCHYYGVSLVYFISPHSQAMVKLTSLYEKLKKDCQNTGIEKKLAFLPPPTYHITLFDIAVLYDASLEEKIIQKIHAAFDAIQQKKVKKLPVSLNKSIVISDRASLIIPIEPIDEKTLEDMYTIRENVAMQMQSFAPTIQQKNPYYFTGHISLAYIIQSMSSKEYETLKKIVQTYHTDDIVDTLEIDTIELRRFETMEDWGNAPILTYTF